MKVKGYQATRDADGVLTVHRVPIFVECERGDVCFDRKWIDEAVKAAKIAERDGYFPPLHVRHHEMGTELNDSVRPAGHFRVLGAKELSFKGDRLLAVFADLVITDPLATEDVLRRRLPYRSVEIFNVEKPKLDSLALLDHEAPYLELPMLFVSDVDEPARDSATPILDGTFASATFANPWTSGRARSSSGVVACFRRGGATLVITEDEQVTETDEAVVTDEPEVTSEAFAADGPPEPPKPGASSEESSESSESSEEPESTPAQKLDCGAIIDAIMDGSISVADFKSIRAAMDQQDAAQAQQQQTQLPNPMNPAPTGTAPAPAAAPGRESMSAQENSTNTTETRPEAFSAREAQLKGRVDALEASFAAREAEDQRRVDVDEALARLDGRPLGADFRSKLEEMHESGGREAFQKYVDSMVETFAAVPSGDDRAARFAAQNVSASEAVMAYQEQGSDAVEKAARFSAEWRQLSESGGTRMSEKRYLELNMARG